MDYSLLERLEAHSVRFVSCSNFGVEKSTGLVR